MDQTSEQNENSLTFITFRNDGSAVDLDNMSIVSDASHCTAQICMFNPKSVEHMPEQWHHAIRVRNSRTDTSKLYF